MELIRALGELAEVPGSEQVRNARLLELAGEPNRAEYTDLFVVQLYPYASVYLSADGQVGGQVQEHISGFWRVLRQPIPRDPDHIATLLSTYAQVVDRSKNAPEAYVQELTKQMRHAFLWEHLVSWMLPFVARVIELGSPVYRSWGMLLLDALEAEATHVGAPTALPLHLRGAPPLPRDSGLDALIEGIFSPVRSGVILTRADLARCARDLGLKTRVADRRHTLKTLLSQDVTRVAGWLANESRRQADLMTGKAPAFRLIADHWEQRALGTADLLARGAEYAVRLTTPPATS